MATTRQCPAHRRTRYERKGARVTVLPARSGKVRLEALMDSLGSLGLLHVLCEGGGTLAEGLIKDGLVDEYAFFVAPSILGGREAVPAIGGRGWDLPACPSLEILSCERVGTDLYIRAVPKAP